MIYLGLNISYKWNDMHNFFAGIILGATVGVAASLVVNPMDKKDMYKNCCRASRMMKKMNRSINRAMHNFIWTKRAA